MKPKTLRAGAHAFAQHYEEEASERVRSAGAVGALCALFLSLSLCVCLYFSLLYLTAFVPSVFLFLPDSLSLSLPLSLCLPLSSLSLS